MLLKKYRIIDKKIIFKRKTYNGASYCGGCKYHTVNRLTLCSLDTESTLGASTLYYCRTMILSSARIHKYIKPITFRYYPI